MTWLRILSCATVLLGTGPALAVTDDATGLGVDPPMPFTARLENRQGRPVIAISSTTGRPVSGMTNPATGAPDSDVCVVTFRPAPQNASMTQQEINEFQVRPEMVNATKAMMQIAFDVGEPNVFETGGIAGLEFEGTLKGRQAGQPVYTASMQTPKGVTALTCFATLADFPDAVAQFRAIRDVIKPPR